VLHLAALFAVTLATSAAPTVVDNPYLRPTPFRELVTPRDDGSALHFFAPVGALADPTGRPIVVWAEGSGCNALFPVREGQLRYGLYAVLAGLVPDAFVVSAEKRGIPFGHIGPGGAAAGCPAEFIEHTTLAGRAGDIRAMLSALRARGADTSRVLVIGHSEGADVAAQISLDPSVSHVAFLAGGGPVQMFDFAVLIRRQGRENQLPADAIERAVTALEDDFRKIQAEPDSTTKFFRGHAYRRWADYLSHPPMVALLRSKARLFVAHGSDDKAVPIESFDLLSMELVRNRREGITVKRYPGAGHGLAVEGTHGPALESAFRDALNWFGLQPGRP
jgi:pimeloyl-ACP methyl ester carboxylesterase